MTGKIKIETSKIEQLKEAAKLADIRITGIAQLPFNYSLVELRYKTLQSVYDMFFYMDVVKNKKG